MHELIDTLIDSLTGLIGGNLFLSALVALLAGLLSSLSPCLMTTVPLLVGYVGADRANNQRRRAVLYSLLFCAGVVVTFTLFGVASAFLGWAFSAAGALWNLLLAALLVVVALDQFGVVHLLHRHADGECACGHEHPGHSHAEHSARREGGSRSPRVKRGGYIGAFLLGLMGGVFTSPCATPALVTIMALVTAEGGIFNGVLLLFFYAVGHSALIMAAGCSTGLINRMTASKNSARIGKIARIAFGVLILALAAFLAYTAFVPIDHVHAHG